MSIEELIYIDPPDYAQLLESLKGSRSSINHVLSYLYLQAEKFWRGDESLSSLSEAHKSRALKFLTLEVFGRMGDVPCVRAEFFREVLEDFVHDRLIEKLQVYLKRHSISFNEYQYEEEMSHEY